MALSKISAIIIVIAKQTAENKNGFSFNPKCDKTIMGILCKMYIPKTRLPNQRNTPLLIEILIVSKTKKIANTKATAIKT